MPESKIIACKSCRQEVLARHLRGGISFDNICSGQLRVLSRLIYQVLDFDFGEQGCGGQTGDGGDREENIDSSHVLDPTHRIRTKKGARS